MKLTPQPAHSPPLPQAASAAGAVWLRDWQVDEEPLAKSSTEEVFLVRHRHSQELAWLHRVLGMPGMKAEVLGQFFSKAATLRSPVAFAELLGWGWHEGEWSYLTRAGSAESLTTWKLRRQASSATSIRMRLMLQAIQAAQQLLLPSEPGRTLAMPLVSVDFNQDQAEPYRLRFHSWMPMAGNAEANAHQLLIQTESILNKLTAGMPWPADLTRTFHDVTLSPAMRLQRSERILLTHLKRQEGPAAFSDLEEKKRRRGAQTFSFLTLGGFFTIITVVLMRDTPKLSRGTGGAVTPSPHSVVTAPKQKSENADRPILAPPPPPPPSGPTELTVALQTLNSARITKHPGTILTAAQRVLALDPEAPGVRAIIQQLLRDEIMRQVNLSAHPALTPSGGWEPLAEAHFVEAKILLALSRWETNTTDSLQELQLLADQNSTVAMVLLGQLLATTRSANPDYPRAFAYFKSAAEAKDPAGNYLTGECYYYGKGVAKDASLAIPYLEFAAAQGDVRAMDLLGKSLATGVGQPKNLAKSAEWFHQAIAAGFTPSLGRLATLYLNGDGVEKNITQAIDLLRRGEELNDAECLYQLGHCYQRGMGVKKSIELAREYFTKANSLSHPQAASALQSLEKQSIR
jgi:TPR repeat protein